MNKKLMSMIEKHIANRIEVLDSEIGRIVDEIINTNIRDLTSVAFGLDSRWGRLETGRDFVSHPIGSLLTQAAKRRAEEIVNKITDDKKFVTDKDLARWRTAYKKYYQSELDSHVEKLVKHKAWEDAMTDAEDMFRQAMAKALEDMDA